MPDKFDPDERFKLDMEPEEAIRKFLDGDKTETEPEDDPEDDPEAETEDDA